MQPEKLEQIINLIARGDTSSAELLFDKPGGRKYFENLMLVVITNLPYSEEEKAALFVALISALNRIEKRIRRQKEGQKILQTIYPS
jgi:ribosome-associated translation inhibitor RaiA